MWVSRVDGMGWTSPPTTPTPPTPPVPGLPHSLYVVGQVGGQACKMARSAKQHYLCVTTPTCPALHADCQTGRACLHAIAAPPSPASRPPPRPCWLCACWRQVGKALFDGQLIDAYFTRSFYKHLLGAPLTYVDLEAVDPDYYKVWGGGGVRYAVRLRCAYGYGGTPAAHATDFVLFPPLLLVVFSWPAAVFLVGLPARARAHAAPCCRTAAPPRRRRSSGCSTTTSPTCWT